jgi:O-antigen/teichoic acid export membrane protein
MTAVAVGVIVGVLGLIVIGWALASGAFPAWWQLALAGALALGIWGVREMRDLWRTRPGRPVRH